MGTDGDGWGTVASHPTVPRNPLPQRRAALSLLGVSAMDALFVGDSPHDVEAGRAARVHTVGVTWGAFTREEMVASGADVVIDKVSELSEVVTQFSNRRDRLQTF